VEEQRRLRLRAGEAELPRVRIAAPSRGVATKSAKAVRNVALIEPFDRASCLSDDLRDPLGLREPYRARAVLSNVRDPRELVPCRHLKPTCPSLEDDLVVRQQAPEVRIDGRVT